MNPFRIWCVAVALLLAVPVVAQDATKEEADRFEAGMLANYHYHFQEADSVLALMRKHDPKSTKTLLLDLNVRWWKLLSGAGEDEIYTGMEEIKVDKSRHKASMQGENSLQAQYEYCAISVFQSRFKFYRKQIFPAFMTVYDFVGELRKTLGKEEENPWFKLSSGIYRYYVERGGQRYPYLYPFLALMPSGDKEQGLQLLQEGFASSNQLLSTECAYFLLKINLEEEKNYSEAYDYASHLRKNYPQNLFFRFMECKALIGKGELKLAQMRAEELKVIANGLRPLSVDQRSHYVQLLEEEMAEHTVDQ